MVSIFIPRFLISENAIVNRGIIISKDFITLCIEFLIENGDFTNIGELGQIPIEPSFTREHTRQTLLIRDISADICKTDYNAVFSKRLAPKSFRGHSTERGKIALRRSGIRGRSLSDGSHVDNIRRTTKIFGALHTGIGRNHIEDRAEYLNVPRTATGKSLKILLSSKSITQLVNGDGGRRGQISDNTRVSGIFRKTDQLIGSTYLIVGITCTNFGHHGIGQTCNEVVRTGNTETCKFIAISKTKIHSIANDRGRTTERYLYSIANLREGIATCKCVKTLATLEQHIIRYLLFSHRTILMDTCNRNGRADVFGAEPLIPYEIVRTMPIGRELKVRYSRRNADIVGEVHGNNPIRVRTFGIRRLCRRLKHRGYNDIVQITEGACALQLLPIFVYETNRDGEEERIKVEPIHDRHNRCRQTTEEIELELDGITGKNLIAVYRVEVIDINGSLKLKRTLESGARGVQRRSKTKYMVRHNVSFFCLCHPRYIISSIRAWTDLHEQITLPLRE